MSKSDDRGAVEKLGDHQSQALRPSAERPRRSPDRKIVVAAFLVLICAIAPEAHAANLGLAIEPDIGFSTSGADDEEKPGQPPSFPGGELLSAFHKERQALKDKGITFSLHEHSEVWANVTGGGHQGSAITGSRSPSSIGGDHSMAAPTTFSA